METLDYYKLIRNHVQIYKAELVSMNCLKRYVEKKSEKSEVQILLSREVNLVTEKRVEIILHSIVSIPDGPFEFDIVYKGFCGTNAELDSAQLEQYAYDQVVPLLLPYVRECVASTMARMGLPIFTLPTMDVLDAIEANRTPEEEQE
ncbi:hypothetical protein [Pseudalkalibacillus sp. JSM 102089]|uniref:hypothetical protein n=1 Tax=Pseudalkalibacillus sp. JSM 102089 TaxID=3229856 RepID=UPI0035250519